MKRQVTVFLNWLIPAAALLIAAIMAWPPQASLAQSGGATSATPPAQATPSPQTDFTQIERQATAVSTPTPAGIIGQPVSIVEAPIAAQAINRVYLPLIMTAPSPTPTPTPTLDPTGEPSGTPDPTGEPSATPDPTGEPTATATPGDVPAQVTEVIELTNQERVKAGCDPLQMNALLNQAAYGHSEDMALNDFFAHNSPDGSSPGDRVSATGYKYRALGENIAAGQWTATMVVNGWMGSDGHRKNILNCNYEEIGVGYYFLQNDSGNFNGYYYWTQVFASPK